MENSQINPDTFSSVTLVIFVDDTFLSTSLKGLGFFFFQ